jgi:ribosomal protein S4
MIHVKMECHKLMVVVHKHVVVYGNKVRFECLTLEVGDEIVLEL